MLRCNIRMHTAWCHEDKISVMIVFVSVISFIPSSVTTLTFQVTDIFTFVIPNPWSLKGNFNYILSTLGRAKRFISSQKRQVPTQPPIQWLVASLSAKVKRPWPAGNHSPLSSEIKKLVNLYHQPSIIS